MNILIINFRRFGDIFSTGHLVKSYRDAYPGVTVSMLVYEEFVAAAKIIDGIENIYTIDRKKIVSLKCNPIFSDSYALNSFAQDLSDVAATCWDKIVNCSNDEVSSLIASYLIDGTDKKQVHGVSFTQNMGSISSCDWSLLFNDVMTGLEHPIMHFSDCHHQMCELPRGSETNKVKIDHSYQQQVESNLKALRKRESSKELPIKLIGIHLKSADERKNIPLETTISLIEEILDDPTLYPIMLIAPNQDERSIANLINRSFDNKLVAIEASFSALVSVLHGLDLLVTPDTAPKHMADLTGTPVVEIVTGPAPMRKQGTYLSGNVVVTTKLDCAPCLVKEPCQHEITNKCCKMIQAQDIMAAIHKVLSPGMPIQEQISDGVTLYQSELDQLGITYRPVAGAFNKIRELSIMMSRQMVLAKMNKSESNYHNIVQTINDPMLIKSWIRAEKTSITKLSKSLLNTLRFVFYAQKNHHHVTELANATNLLLEFADYPGVVGIMGRMLQGKIEALRGQPMEQNIKEMETLLYSTKSDIQSTINCLQKLDSCLEPGISCVLSRSSTVNQDEIS